MTDELKRVAALHSAARRYLIERYERWSDHYAAIGGGGGGRYSKEQLDTFPRYNVASAMLEAIERVTPDELGALPAARERLATLASTAESPFTRPPQGKIEQRAMAEERDAFAQYIRAVPDAEVLVLDLLPFRRVLRDDEVKAHASRLAEVWGVQGDYWYPLSDALARADVRAFQAPYFRRALATGRLNEMLAQAGTSCLFELRESGPSYEIELSTFDPVYTGAEGYWFDRRLEWIIYASHESSITVGGRLLLDEIARAWPEWHRYVWTTAFY